MRSLCYFAIFDVESVVKVLIVVEDFEVELYWDQGHRDCIISHAPPRTYRSCQSILLLSHQPKDSVAE